MCELYSLSKENLDAVLVNHPDVRESMKSQAQFMRLKNDMSSECNRVSAFANSTCSTFLFQNCCLTGGWPGFKRHYSVMNSSSSASYERSILRYIEDDGNVYGGATSMRRFRKNLQ